MCVPFRLFRLPRCRCSRSPWWPLLTTSPTMTCRWRTYHPVNHNNNIVNSSFCPSKFSLSISRKFCDNWKLMFVILSNVSFFCQIYVELCFRKPNFWNKRIIFYSWAAFWFELHMYWSVSCSRDLPIVLTPVKIQNKSFVMLILKVDTGTKIT